jgi:hypothetical protein
MVVVKCGGLVTPRAIIMMACAALTRTDADTGLVGTGSYTLKGRAYAAVTTFARPPSRPGPPSLAACPAAACKPQYRQLRHTTSGLHHNGGWTGGRCRGSRVKVACHTSHVALAKEVLIRSSAWKPQPLLRRPHVESLPLTPTSSSGRGCSACVR